LQFHPSGISGRGWHFLTAIKPEQESLEVSPCRRAEVPDETAAEAGFGNLKRS